MTKALDKNAILSRFGRKSGVHALPDGGEIAINALTLPQRERMQEALKVSNADAVVLIVAMGCETFSESELDVVGGLDDDLLFALSNAILDLSGLADDPEKN
jgi:hypothetical protein